MSEERRRNCGFQLAKAAGGQAEKLKPPDTTEIRIISEGPPSRAFVVRRDGGLVMEQTSAARLHARQRAH
jgi:hypothetical protein